MAVLMLVNPRKRRKTKRKSSARSKSGTVVRYRTRKTKKRIRRRRNPIGMRGVQASVMNAVKNGAIGSVGAIAGTVVGNLLPLPETLKAGNMGLVIDALIGIGTGMLVGNFTNKKIGESMAQGAVTVALHGTMKNIISQAIPALNLAGFDDGLLGDYDDGLLAYDYDDGMSAYDDNLGYSGAGMTNPLDDDLGEYDESGEMDY